MRSNHEAQPMSSSSTVPAFLFLGIYGIAMALPLTLVGMFVGPHILAGAAVHFLTGIASLAVVRGQSRGARWAHVAGSALALLVVGMCSVAIVQMARERVEPVAFVVPSTTGLLFLGVLLRSYRAGFVRTRPDPRKL